MAFQRVVYVLQSIGLGGIIRTIQYGLARDLAERRYSHKAIKSKKSNPGRFIRYIALPGGIQLDYENARAEIIYLKPNLVRVSWEPGRAPIPYTLTSHYWEAVQPHIESRAEQVILSTKASQCVIDPNGGISFGDSSGAIFRMDEPPARQGDQWQLSTHMAADEHVYGLGERASTLNLRPGRYTCWNTDPGGQYSHGKDPLYLSPPIYLSLSTAASYLVYFENSYLSTFEFVEECEAIFSGGMLRYYVMAGSLEQIYRDLADLTGYPYMPPNWSLGYHQSRWSYGSEDEVRAVVAGFEEHNLPLSAIHLDIDYMDGYRLFTIDHQRFPALARLTHDLDEKGVKVVAIVDPSVKRDSLYNVYSEGLQQDVFCKQPDGKIEYGTSWPGWSAFPDFTKPAARSWWQKQYKALLELGVSGIWHDMNEPASFAAWGDKSLPSSTQHDFEGRGGGHAEAHNLYGLLMNQAGYQAIRQYSPHKRPWIVSRAGWAGSQRFAWNWTGDVETSWEALRQVIPTILGLGLSGQAFTGVDIGGFSGNPDAELYLRWFQLAAFLPFFRTHSAIGTKPREPWVYGEPTTGILRKFMNLRQQLMPYLYTLAWQATQNGLPLVRPIFWDNPAELSLWNIEDEFLLGESVLVAPICHQGEKIRRVVLPPGNWYSFWDERCYAGPATINLPAPAEIIPIFVKGGQLLPMEIDRQLVLHTYIDFSKSKSAQIYLDKGDGYDAWRLDTFHIIPSQNKLQIAWSPSGDYPFPYNGLKIAAHGRTLKTVIADGASYSIHENSVIVPLFNTMQLELESN